MPIGPELPGWLKLRGGLQKLRTSTGAESAYIVDAWGVLWCWAHSPTSISASKTLCTAAQAKCRKIMNQLDAPLERGGAIDAFRLDDRIRSFANVYLLVLEMVPQRPRAHLDALVVASLPELERLTLALPSPDGPGPQGARGFGAA